MKLLKENSGILPTKMIPFPFSTESKFAQNFLLF